MLRKLMIATVHITTNEAVVPIEGSHMPVLLRVVCNVLEGRQRKETVTQNYNKSATPL